MEPRLMEQRLMGPSVSLYALAQPTYIHAILVRSSSSFQ